MHVWTVDDPAAMQRMLDAGVDGIITDRTDLLRDVLIERGQWADPRHTRCRGSASCQAVIAVMLFQPEPTCTTGMIHPPVPFPRYM